MSNFLQPKKKKKSNMTINIFPTGFYRPLHMSRQTLKWLKKKPLHPVLIPVEII